MDIVLHPRFAENQFVYLSYGKPVNEKQVRLGLARGRWNGSALIDVKDIFVAGPGTSDAPRLAFGRDGTLFMSTGGGGPTGAQNPATHGGRVLRLNDDGSVPADNSLVGRADHAPEVYSLGHRNSLGLAVDRRQRKDALSDVAAAATWGSGTRLDRSRVDNQRCGCTCWWE
jgi:glucose/arabinose dehydrogenase